MAEEIVATGGFIPDDIMLKVLSTKLDLLHNKVRARFGAEIWCIRSEYLALDLGWLSSHFGSRKASGRTHAVC